MEPGSNRHFWRRAGLVTSLWGYDRRQRYLDGVSTELELAALRGLLSRLVPLDIAVDSSAAAGCIRPLGKDIQRAGALGRDMRQGEDLSYREARQGWRRKSGERRE